MANSFQNIDSLSKSGVDDDVFARRQKFNIEMDIQGLASLSHCSEYPKALFPMMPYVLTKQFNDIFAEHEPRDWCELPGFRL